MSEITMYAPPASVPWAAHAAGASKPGVPSWIAPRRSDPREGFSSGPPPRRSASPLSRPTGEERKNPLEQAKGEVQVLKDEVATLRRALTEAVSSAARARKIALEASERDLVSLATAIAERVIGRELQADASMVVNWAKEGIAVMGQKDAITVYIAQDLAEQIPLELWQAALGETFAPVVDPTLPASQCRVSGEYSVVDQTVKERLDAVTRAMEAPGQ